MILCSHWKKKSRKECKDGRKDYYLIRAQSIPTYIMVCFNIPLGVFRDMETLTCKLW